MKLVCFCSFKGYSGHGMAKKGFCYKETRHRSSCNPLKEGSISLVLSSNKSRTDHLRDWPTALALFCPVCNGWTRNFMPLISSSGLTCGLSATMDIIHMYCTHANVLTPHVWICLSLKCCCVILQVPIKSRQFPSCCCPIHTHQVISFSNFVLLSCFIGCIHRSRHMWHIILSLL